jgi:hypothetical protein
LTEPALPPALEFAKAMIPLAGLFRRSGPCAITFTVPPSPGPDVVLAIYAPPFTVKLPAVTDTEAAGPDCRPVADAAIWVLAIPAPLSTNAPTVVTKTEPPGPVPAVVLAISAPRATVISGARTTTDPALLLAVEVAEATIPVPGSTRLSGPCVVTCTVPPSPVPVVVAMTCAPELRATGPATVRARSPPAPDP